MHKLNEGVRPVEILLVEDNPGDVILTKKAFETAKIANNITIAKDGEEAINMLKRREGYEDYNIPDIILLDLNLPKKDGREVLEEIKVDDNLKHIPIVVLTSSKAERDVVESYNLHANSYIIKPVDLEKFAQVVESIENFWFTVVVLPDDGKTDAEQA